MYNTHTCPIPYTRGSVHTGGHQAWLMVSVWPIVRFVSEARKKSLRSKSIEPSEKRALFFSFAACSLFCVLLRRLAPSSFQFARSPSSLFLLPITLRLFVSLFPPSPPAGPTFGPSFVRETLNSSGGVSQDSLIGNRG